MHFIKPCLAETDASAVKETDIIIKEETQCGIGGPGVVKGIRQAPTLADMEEKI